MSPLDDVLRKYSSQRTHYEEFATQLKHLLENLIRNARIDFYTVESRAKSIDSFRAKVERPGKGYLNPLQEVSDLAGVRVILYYEDHLPKVCKLLEKEFEIESSQSADKSNALADDQFGYLSIHYVLNLSKARHELPEWTRYRDLKAEIQVRTVLQHAWASISHKLQYKRESETPRGDRRRLSRLAGLFELADEQFSVLRKQLSSTSRRIKRNVAQKKYGVAVDLASVTEYIRTSDAIARLTKKFKEHGLQVTAQLGNAEQLTSIAVGLQLHTIASLNSCLNNAVADLDSFLPAFIHEQFGEGKDQWSIFPVGGDPDHWATVALLQSQVRSRKRKDLRQLVPWSDKYFDAVVSASKNVLHP